MTGNEFTDLIETHRHEVYRYILRNVWNPDVADDVMASAVFAAFRQLSKFQDGTNFKAWIYKILTNKCFVANREIKRSAIDVESIDEHFFSTDRKAQKIAFEDPENFLDLCGDEVSEALKQLSSAQRSCLLLLTFEKYSYKEIAEIMEMPVGTVMTHLARGRAKLRRVLVEHAVSEGIVSVEKQQVLEEKEQRKKSTG